MGRKKKIITLSDGTFYPRIPNICYCGKCNEVCWRNNHKVGHYPARKGKPSWNKNIPMKQEIKDKLSISNKKAWQDIEIRKRTIEGIVASREKPEVKENISKAMKKVWSDIDRRKRLSQKLKITKNLPGKKEEQSKRMKIIANDPEVIAKIIATRKINFVRKTYTLENLILDHGEIPLCDCSECKEIKRKIILYPDEYGSYAKYRLYGYPQYISGHNSKDNNPCGMLGKHHTPENIEKFRIMNSGENNNMYDVHMCNENHWNWQGGISYEPYGIEFNDDLKYKIRIRDNHVCQLCEKDQEQELLEYNKFLSIHHIDYNKRNNNTENLISLCIGCHMETNYNRKYYEQYFVLFMKEREKGK